MIIILLDNISKIEKMSSRNEQYYYDNISVLLTYSVKMYIIYMLT